MTKLSGFRKFLLATTALRTRVMIQPPLPQEDYWAEPTMIPSQAPTEAVVTTVTTGAKAV